MSTGNGSAPTLVFEYDRHPLLARFMWLLTFLVSICGKIEDKAKWEELGEDGKALWRAGDGCDFCFNAAHVTSACVTAETSTGEKKTFCSNAKYTDQAGNSFQSRWPASPNPNIPCVPTRETGEALQRQHPGMPHRHSEIAALQHLFGIDGSKTIGEWATCIKRVLTGEVEDQHFLAGSQRVQIWLYNSKQAPCVTSATTEGGKRRPCDTFLRDLVAKVNEKTQGHIRFAIQVRWGKPNTEPVKYGAVETRDEPKYRRISREARRRRRRVRRHYAALF